MEKSKKNINKTQLKDLFLKRYKELNWHRQDENLVAYLNNYLLGVRVETMTFTLSKHTLTILDDANGLTSLKYTFKLDNDKYYTDLMKKVEESDIQKCMEFIERVLQQQKELKEFEKEREQIKEKYAKKQELSGETCEKVSVDESNVYKNLSPVTTADKPSAEPSKNAFFALLPFIAGIVGLCFFAFYAK